jgi:hypothetical protein
VVCRGSTFLVRIEKYQTSYNFRPNCPDLRPSLTETIREHRSVIWWLGFRMLPCLFALSIAAPSKKVEHLPRFLAKNFRREPGAKVLSCYWEDQYEARELAEGCRNQEKGGTKSICTDWCQDQSSDNRCAGFCDELCRIDSSLRHCSSSISLPLIIGLVLISLSVVVGVIICSWICCCRKKSAPVADTAQPPSPAPATYGVPPGQYPGQPQQYPGPPPWQYQAPPGPYQGVPPYGTPPA